MADVEYRLATPRDAADIVAVTRAGFDPGFIGMTVYGSPRVERFVEAQIAARPLGEPTAYAVAAEGARVVGCAEVRRLPDALFLNYLSVAPGLRCGGVGRALTAFAIVRAREHGHQHMKLDVLESNSVALGWYTRLGLREEYRSAWYVVDAAPGDCAAGRYYAEGLPQADACHAAFGFSQFTMSTPDRRYNVGRLGTDWFRVTDRAALADANMLAALHRVDPGRKILAILREDEVPPALRPAGRLAARTLRLSGDLESFAGRLSLHQPGRP